MIPEDGHEYVQHQEIIDAIIEMYANVRVNMNIDLDMLIATYAGTDKSMCAMSSRADNPHYQHEQPMRAGVEYKSGLSPLIQFVKCIADTVSLSSTLRKIDELIKHGADLNEQDALGKTALHHAVIGGFFEVVVHLLEAGANIKIVDSHKRTAQDFAGDVDNRRLVGLFDDKVYMSSLQPPSRARPFPACTTMSSVAHQTRCRCNGYTS
jgi:hypothetical protein